MSEPRFRLSSILLGVMLGLIALSPFAPATSPLPPPFHQYSISGTIARPAGGSRENIPVALFGFSRYTYPVGQYSRLTSVTSSRYADWPVGLTDSSGSFSVRASADFSMDSVRVGILTIDRPTVFGPAIVPDSSMMSLLTEWYSVERTSDCSGCGSNPSTSRERTIGIRYSLPTIQLTLEF